MFLTSAEMQCNVTLLQGVDMEVDDDKLTPEQRQTLKKIRARRKVIVSEHRLKKGTANNQAVAPRRADTNRQSTVKNMKVGAASLH